MSSLMLNCLLRRSYCCREGSMPELPSTFLKPVAHFLRGTTRRSGIQMKTVTLCGALFLVCLTATSGCANRRPMCRDYNCCPQPPSYCPSPCPSPCYGGGQMAYPAGYGGTMPDAPTYGGYMPSAPNDGGMMSHPTSYGEAGCPNCN
jgi:hypothetical protein